ncbi:hypothetical protein C1645_768830 [Glomus cerebriforme]|uniref:Uncharacterized protein n=1 Tax=Glomus cerebriforme TaxID=658196 RepID=A0A397T792_9GLOM|nr:hypothetical protein C1645_768830 [Glomus cerebriforme]
MVSSYVSCINFFFFNFFCATINSREFSLLIGLIVMEVLPIISSKFIITTLKAQRQIDFINNNQPENVNEVIRPLWPISLII